MQDEVKKLAHDFINEMNAWEKYCNALEDDPDIDEKKETSLMRSSARKIFKAYCTDKKRAQGLPNVISYGCEGSYEYVAVTLEDLTVSESGTKFLVQWGDDEFSQYQLQIIKKKGALRIDSKKRFSSYKKKWVYVDL